MRQPLAPPKRKNPLARTRQPLLPPSQRSRTAHGLTEAAAEGRFALQRCEACNTFTYPPRDACPECLSSRLVFTDAPSSGKLLAETTIHISSDPYFREHMPWKTGLVRLDCGPRAVVHLHRGCVEGARVNLTLQLDRSGQAVLFAAPEVEAEAMRDDPQRRQLTADPQYRRVLVTDGRNAVGQAMAAALLRAGAARVFVGIAEPWKPYPGEAELNALEDVEIVPLDLTDERSVCNLAADIGAKVDIIIDTTDHNRPTSIFAAGSVRVVGDALNATLLGALRLAQAFGPILQSRGADGVNNAAAWTNILSAYALESHPAHGPLSVSHAGCLSLSHWLRAELRKGGVRLMNVFTGPVDTEWYQMTPPPKVSPSALAAAVVDGLKRGLEEVYAGDVARDIRERQRANPKALEREIGQ